MATDTATPVSTASRWSRSPYSGAVALYVAIRVATVAVVALANTVSHKGLIYVLSKWDGKWFLMAANHGYPSHLPMIDGHVQSNTIAFFPLFPLTIRGLEHLTGLSGAVVGLWISAVTGLVAVVAVGALTRVYAGDAAARRASVLFALAPGSFVFSLIYNEGIVITLAVIGIWALMRQRWVLAGLMGAVATATSPVGFVFVVVAVAAALRAVARDRQWGALAAPILAPVGFLIWTGYLWAHTGTVRAWELTERGGWHSYPSFMYPLWVIAKFVSNPLSPTMTGQLLFFGTVLTALGVVIVLRERMPGELKVYAVTAFILFAISAPVGLRPRFVMLAFPITMAVATRWSGRTYRVIVALSAVALLLMSFETLASWAVFP